MAHKYDKPGGIAVGKHPVEFHVVRKIDGTVNSDTGPFNVATYPKEGDQKVAVNCEGYATIFVRAAFTGGGTVKVTPRVLDPEEVDPAPAWFRLAASNGTVVETAAIDAAADRCYELQVANRTAVFFQVTISGAVADLVLYGTPGQRY